MIDINRAKVGVDNPTGRPQSATAVEPAAS
jgi:hypothetical protein